jgi:hypothetical protein
MSAIVQASPDANANSEETASRPAVDEAMVAELRAQVAQLSERVTSRMPAAHSIKTNAPLEATANREAVIDQLPTCAPSSPICEPSLPTRASNGLRGTPPSAAGL